MTHERSASPPTDSDATNPLAGLDRMLARWQAEPVSADDDPELSAADLTQTQRAVDTLLDVAARARAKATP